MKILVIEDKQMHQDSARQTLVDHDVTLVSSYDEATKVLGSKGFNFEVVLTDMNLPMGSKNTLNEAFKSGEQVPYGFVLALMAAHCGAKYVAMVTDANHHKGAMSAALDNLGPTYYESWCGGFESVKVFKINDAKVVFVHTPFIGVPRTTCPTCQGASSGCGVCVGDGLDRGKDWGKVLMDLTKEEK